MAAIKGIESLSPQALVWEVRSGGRFVVYEYCVSLLVVTFKRTSDVHFIRADENRILKGLGYTLVSLLCGWWGFPWGFIYTPMALATNFGGGRDVTDEVMTQLAPPPRQPDPNRWNWPDGEVDGHYHHKLRITRRQLRMGETVSLTIADGSTFQVKLSPQMPEDARLRLANVYRNGTGDVFVHLVLIDP